MMHTIRGHLKAILHSQLIMLSGRTNARYVSPAALKSFPAVLRTFFYFFLPYHAHRALSIAYTASCEQLGIDIILLSFIYGVRYLDPALKNKDIPSCPDRDSSGAHRIHSCNQS